MKDNQNQQPEWGYVNGPSPPGPPSQAPPNSGWKQPPPPNNYQPGPYPPNAQQYGQQYGQQSGPAAYYPERSSYYYPVEHKLPKGMSIASLVLGLLSLLLAPFITGPLAAILGGIAIGRCNRGEATGKGMAVAGVILGIVGVIGWIVLLAALGPEMELELE